MTPKIWKNEEGYLGLLRHILSKGVTTPDRTDVGECRKVFNQTLWFDLRESQPVVTHRPIPIRWAFEEFLFFMSGNTDTTVLEEKGITLWSGNTSREFLDNRGLREESVGSMGKAYGYQWRNFNGEGVDQLKQTIDLLRNDPHSRRILTTFWNPAQSNQMALTPCFYEHKFNVEKSGGKDILHMTVKSRSCDAPFGLPFNYTQYGVYLAAVAKLVGMTAGVMCIEMDDVHVYKNQIEYTEEVITRDYYEVKWEPWKNGWSSRTNQVDLNINKELNTLEDLVGLQWEDLEFTGHNVNKEKFVTPKPPMAI